MNLNMTRLLVILFAALALPVLMVGRADRVVFVVYPMAFVYAFVLTPGL